MTALPYELQKFLDNLAHSQKQNFPTVHPAWKSMVAAGYVALWNLGYRPDPVGDWYLPTESGPDYIGRISMSVTSYERSGGQREHTLNVSVS